MKSVFVKIVLCIVAVGAIGLVYASYRASTPANRTKQTMDELQQSWDEYKKNNPDVK